METKTHNLDNQNDKAEQLTPKIKFGFRNGVTKRSLRPIKSVKRISVTPKKFLGVVRVQKEQSPQEKNAELI